MRSVLLICTLVVSAAAAQAQQVTSPQGSSLTGRIVGPDGSGVAAAAVAVRAASDTALVAGAITDAYGGFRVPGLAAGRYTVRVDVVGFVPRTLEVEAAAGARTVSAGIIQLVAQPVSLDPLSVAGVRAPVVLAADRTIYDVRRLPVAEAGAATDVLRHIDELEVDGNGRVTMRGDRPVAIHMNGRPAPVRGEQLQEFLQQLPGKGIARIEVMPNPSARYDPEGMGGIVNIVLRSDAPPGASGNIGAHANTTGAGGLSGRIAVQKGRTTFFGGGSGTSSRNRNEVVDQRLSLDTSPGSVFERRSTSRRTNLVGFGDLSLEYKVAEHTTAWVNGYASSHGHDTRSVTTHSDHAAGEDASAGYGRHIDVASPHTFVDWGIGIKRGVTPGTGELTADIRWTANRGRSSTRALRTESDDADRAGVAQQDRSAEVMDAWILRLDYMHPFGSRGAVASGFAVSQRDLREDALRELHEGSFASPVATQRATSFAYHEAVQTVYFTADGNAGRFTAQLGLRGELARSRFHNGDPGEELANDYGSLFPSVNMGYRLGGGRALRFGYTKRVGRPPAHLLNAERVSDDPTVLLKGNPGLGPNYTHTVNAEYSWIGTRGTLRVAPYYRRTFDQWEPIRSLRDDGIMLVTWANTATIRQAGTTLIMSRPQSGRIGGSLSAALYHNLIDASNVSTDHRRASVRWSAGATALLRLSDLATASANANYTAPRDLPQGRMGASLNSSVGVRRQLRARTATINLLVVDPLNLHRFNLQSRDQTFAQSMRTTPRMRGVNISFTWNIGKPPQQQSRRATEEPQGS